MKTILITFVLNLAPILLGLGAILLAYENKDGWGWFLACSVISAYICNTLNPYPAKK